MKKATKRAARKKAAKKKQAIEPVQTLSGPVVFEPKGENVVRLAIEIDVVDQESADKAGELRGAISDLIAEVREDFDEHVAAANKLHKGLTATRKKHIEPLEAADKLIVSKLRPWADKEMTRRLAAAELAAKQAQDERAVDAAVLIEDLVAAGIPEDIARDAVDGVGMPKNAAEPVRIKGQSVGSEKAYEIEDERAFYRAIANGDLPTTLARPSSQELKAYAKAHGRAGSIRGALRIFERSSIRRSAR